MTAEVESNQVIDNVKDFYGKRVKKIDDLQTEPRVAPGRKVISQVREAIESVHDVVASKYYGCGLVIPEKVHGMKILDLGSGTGRDCFALSKLVGQEGHVTGIDMTDEQIAVAREYLQYHTEKFGYSKPNTDFVQGYIEKLTEAGLKDNYYDIIVSNCVVNLSPDKRAVLQEAHKVLKNGGEIFFSDIYADRVLEESARKHEVLWGEGISGALVWKELHTLAKEIGFSKPYMVSATPYRIDRDDFKAVIGDAKFVAVTYRLFKVSGEPMKDTQVIYNGEIGGYEDIWNFDCMTQFKANDVTTVDGEIAKCLQQSRFSDEFEFQPAKKSSCSGTSCSPQDQVDKDDPFKYLEEKEKKGEKVAPACCAGTCC